jgi:AraC-like DNA-binding protein
VCRAGWFQFAPGQEHTNSIVQSRGLFWCKSGHGSFILDGEEFQLEPHDLFVLPWNRKISYRADEKEPMFTAHVHVVPWYREGAEWLANVPHEVDEPMFNSEDRGDLDWFGMQGPVRLHVEADQSLCRLMDYTTRWYTGSPREEVEGRSLGLLVVRELLRLRAMPLDSDSTRPEELRRLLVFVEKSYQRSPTVEEMATIIGRSRSHVLKLFSRHTGASAKSYVIDRQLREARELLLSTTLPISEVGQRVGQSDPYHFSKLFRRHVGLSPREYRVQQGPFSSTPKPSMHQVNPPQS